jgi:hypothetical protein
MLLIFSTKAGGKVFSMPNKTPTFFIKSPTQKNVILSEVADEQSESHPNSVILSGVADEQSESATQSKDPYQTNGSNLPPGVLTAQPLQKYFAAILCHNGQSCFE